MIKGFYTATELYCLVILISEMTKICVDVHPENNLVHEGCIQMHTDLFCVSIASCSLNLITLIFHNTMISKQ